MSTDDLLAQARQQEQTPFDFIIVGSGAGGGPLAARLARAGFIVVQRPGENRPLASVLASSVTLGLGTGRGSNPFAALAWAVSPERGGERLTMEQAVVAMTRGAARAEFADGDKGYFSVGAPADRTAGTMPDERRSFSYEPSTTQPQQQMYQTYPSYPAYRTYESPRREIWQLPKTDPRRYGNGL